MAHYLELLKSQIKGYTKKDGTYVSAHIRHNDKVPSRPANLTHHPRRGENGERVVIKNPSHASAPSTWHSPNSVATFVPNGDFPASLNGIPLTKWREAPMTNLGWNFVDGINDDLDEPPLHVPPGKKPAAGVIIEEADGRVWLIAPTNAFGGYEASFPKGTAEHELSLQANALKECFEESGLQVEITGFVGDFARTTSVARMYRARRVGGSPADMGWESQAVHLVPKNKLAEYLNMESDHAVLPSIIGVHET